MSIYLTAHPPTGDVLADEDRPPVPRRLLPRPPREVGKRGQASYAVGQMPPPPGANPAAVTDAFLRHALEEVRTPAAG